MASPYGKFAPSSLGYWRGGGDAPLAGGSGSGMGPKNQGIGLFSAGTGPLSGGSWEPTVLYLFVLIIAEMVVFGFIARALR